MCAANVGVRAPTPSAQGRAASALTRAVVDTNVWVSGLLSAAHTESPTQRLVRAYADVQFTAVLSRPLLLELTTVVARPRFSSRAPTWSTDAGALKGDRHAYAVNCLTKYFVLQALDRFEVYADSLSLRLGPHDEPEPDIALARATRSYARERPRADEIALIVEVADTSLAFDLGEKRAKYAAAGIPEYWVVDVQGNVVHVLRNPSGDEYADRRTARAGDTISPAEYPDVAIDVALILGEG